MAARRYGRRLRRTAAGTAVAAAAMAALSASQAPGFLPVAHAASHQGGSGTPTPPSDPPIDGGSPYITAMPPLNTPTGPLAPTTAPPGGNPVITVPGGGASLPTTVFDAYQRAQNALAQSDPSCHLPWQLLAAIGQVESGQADGGAVDANGTTYTPILGPVLNGNGFANISDTDHGLWDGDPLHDRAVGPMQFIPSTWATWGADGNGDGVKNPNNVYDAALAAADYLCAGGRNLAVPQDLDQAILGYNHSQAYLTLVKSWYQHFLQGGTVTVPNRSGTPGPGITPPPATPTTPNSPSPKPTTSAGGTITPVPPTGSPTPSTGPTGTPAPTGPTGGPTSPPPSTTPPTTTPPTTPPTTTPPTTPPTTPGCTDSPTPSPTGSGTVSPSPTATSTATPTPDPCATGTTSPTPSATGTAGAVTGPAMTPTS